MSSATTIEKAILKGGEHDVTLAAVSGRLAGVAPAPANQPASHRAHGRRGRFAPPLAVA